MARESNRFETGFAIDRRTFVAGAGAWLLWPRIAAAAHHEGAGGLSAETQKALETSPYVYVSPLKSDGEESRCHGEVWYSWLDGAVVLNTTKGAWKARAVERGLKSARVWVGDHGRWKTALGGKNEAFRAAPMFNAAVERVTDAAVNERMLKDFDVKYPGSIDRWRDKMRDGFASGERHLLRYTPVV